MTKVLLIEDNPSFQKASQEAIGHAKEIFSDRGALQIDGVHSYDHASGLLQEFGFDGVISDLFFPRSEGSKDTTLGIKVLDKIAPSGDSKAQLIIDKFKELKVYEHLTPEARENLVNFADSIPGPLTSSPVYNALVQVSKLGPEVGVHIANKELGANGIITRSLRGTSRNNLFYRNKLEQAMAINSNNQPLGILVGELVKERGIPLVFATSTYHHDDMTQPLINYISANRLGPVVDCNPGKENEKATPVFWEKVYSTLKREMEAKR